MPELSYREAVRDALATAMRQDDDVFIMGEDIAEMGGSMGVTQGMLAESGRERVRNTPISEMALAGAAIGAAMQGMRPIAEIMYEDFMTLASEQIVNQAAKHRYMSGGQVTVPVVFRTQGGAGWSPGAQHAQQLESWFVHIPGLKVVFASTPEDVRGLLWSSIYDDNPVVFFEHRTLYPLKGEVPEEIDPIPIGKARVHRAGARARGATGLRPPGRGRGGGAGERVKGRKAEGEPGKEGEPLYELDTDKVTQEAEAEADGVLLKIAVQEGEVEVGRTIAVIGAEGEEVSVEAPAAPAEPAPAPQGREPEQPRVHEHKPEPPAPS